MHGLISFHLPLPYPALSTEGTALTYVCRMFEIPIEGLKPLQPQPALIRDQSHPPAQPYTQSHTHLSGVEVQTAAPRRPNQLPCRSQQPSGILDSWNSPELTTL